MNTKGIRVLSRKSYEASAVSMFDNPLSSRFDENDALMYFDDVKIPWDRLFVYRDTDMCRQQFHDTFGPFVSKLSSQIRLSIKIKFLLGIARRLTEAIGTTKIPSVSEKLGYMAGKPAWSRRCSPAWKRAARRQANGGCRTSNSCMPRRCSRRISTRNSSMPFRDLSGGALIMLPLPSTTSGIRCSSPSSTPPNVPPRWGRKTRSSS